PVTDLARLAQAKGIRYIGFQHEQSAGNAAAITGYLTQKPGIYLTVSAPGFLNGMVALANATTNGFPMIQMSGSSDRAIVDLQQGDYEELDQMNAAKPYAKAAYRVNRAEDIGIGLARAIRAAVSGRPGGVYLDLPASVLGAALDAETAARSLVRVVDPTPRQLPAPESVKRALDVLANAEWSPTAQFVQLDIVPTEMDSNRAIAAPVVGDIASSVSALLAMLKPGQIRPRSAWLDELARRKQRNLERMATHLAANPDPMDFYSALGAIKGVLADQPEVYLVNEGANTLDIARNVIDMCRPRKRLDSGTWGVMGIGMGYAIGAAVVSGKPVVAIESDSAFGFSGMEIGTICRYHLPIVTVVFNNGGIYRGDDVNHSGGTDPAPTVLMKQAHYEKLIEAFGGVGYYAVDPHGLAKALTDALASGNPALINC